MTRSPRKSPAKIRPAITRIKPSLTPLIYPIPSVQDGVPGEIHKVSFLPRRFMLPAGTLPMVLSPEVTVFRTYPKQVIFVKTPEIQVFLPDSDDYPGPIDLPCPSHSYSTIVCHPMTGCRGSEDVVMQTPGKTILRFWPLAKPHQSILLGFEVIARSPHSIRGEINGDHRHLLQDMKRIIPKEEKKGRFPRDNIDLRVSLLKKNAAKLPKPFVYNTRNALVNHFAISRISFGNEGDEKESNCDKSPPKVPKLATPKTRSSPRKGKPCLEESISMETEEKSIKDKDNLSNNGEVRVTIGDDEITLPSPEKACGKLVRKLRRCCRVL